MANTEGRAPNGKFLPGNMCWKDRSKTNSPKFRTPDELWDAILDYFAWSEDNPLLETQWKDGGKITLPKMRPLTRGMLCMHIGIAVSTWYEWKTSRPDLLPVITVAETAMYEQKFGAAAAGFLKENIIARELGLADKSEVSGNNGGPIQTENVSDLEIARRLLFLLDKGERAMKEIGNE